jgi:DNA-binding MarR family transcriptional regulator
MSRIVHALVEQRLVTRTVKPDDRRSVEIEATKKGVRLLEAGRERRVGALVERLQQLAGSEQRALARGVEILERVTR